MSEPRAHSGLELRSIKVSIHQTAPSPAWVHLKMRDHEFMFYADDFLIFVQWLSAEAKRIKTDDEIDKEIRERHK